MLLFDRISSNVSNLVDPEEETSASIRIRETKGEACPETLEGSEKPEFFTSTEKRKEDCPETLEHEEEPRKVIILLRWLEGTSFYVVIAST